MLLTWRNFDYLVGRCVPSEANLSPVVRSQQWLDKYLLLNRFLLDTGDRDGCLCLESTCMLL